jgi:enoyl-CoA hydratase
MLQFVQIERSESVAILTLQRSPINALDRAALDELIVAFEQVENDDRIRVVLIASGIQGIFCAGVDLKYWLQYYAQRPAEVSRAGRRVFTVLERLSKPTIAAIDGHVIGDGLSLALSCDIRIASKAALFRLPETAYGFIPGWGTIGRLIRVAGRAVTTELLFTGDSLTAKRAQLCGLVNRVTTSKVMMTSALTLARQIAEKSPTALSQAKMTLRPPSTCIEKQQAMEESCFSAVWGSPDWQLRLNHLLEG